MKRFLIPALLAFGAVTLLGLQPASSGPGIVEGTITATPATVEAGESVEIVLEGNCAEFDATPLEHGGSHHVTATITDPKGATVFTQVFTPAAIIKFTFSDTPTLGIYTVTAFCGLDEEDEEQPASSGPGIVEGTAGAAATIEGFYTPGEFTVVEAEAEAADAEPADVVAAAPTFTG